MWDRLALRPVNCVTGNARFLCRYGNVVAAMPPAAPVLSRAGDPQVSMLDTDKEQRLARGWRDPQASEAAPQLLDSPSCVWGQDRPRVWRLRHGPLADLVAEGNVVLMQALARFAPERGFACHLRHLVDPGSDPGARYPQPLAGDLALQDRTRNPF